MPDWIKVPPNSSVTLRFIDCAVGAFPFSEGVWFARYKDREGKWRVARNALGRPLACETEELAISVAISRQSRLGPVLEHSYAP